MCRADDANYAPPFRPLVGSKADHRRYFRQRHPMVRLFCVHHLEEFYNAEFVLVGGKPNRDTRRMGAQFCFMLA